MTEQNENELTAQFQLDQAAASQEEATRDQIVWAQRVRDAETTLAQREAVTRRVVAQAALMEALNVILWTALVAAVVFSAGMALRAVVGVFQ